MEWGFTGVCWQLEQQSNVLKGIDHTLRTPGETQANEFRVIKKSHPYPIFLTVATTLFTK